MYPRNPEDEQIVLYPSHFKWLYQSLKKRMRKLFLVGFLSLFFYLLFTHVPQFQSEAIFKQSQSRHEDLSQLQSFLQNIMRSSQDSNALSIMNSKKVLRKVVEKMGLQIQSGKSHLFSRLWRNFAAELRIFVEDSQDFQFKDVHYDQEIVGQFYLKFSSPENFELLNRKKELIGQGTINQKVELTDGVFTLTKAPANLSFKKLYRFSLIPWNTSVAALQKCLKIKQSKTDKALVCITLNYPERRKGAAIVNQLMAQFQEFLLEEHGEFAKAQVEYLEQRQQFLSEEFNKSLENHSHYLAENLDASGFLGISQEMEMLAIPKESYTSKLFDLDLELKRWEQIEERREDFFADKKEGEYQKQLVALTWAEHPFLAMEKLEKIVPKRFEEQFLGIDLKRLQEIYAEYSQERESLQTQIEDSKYIQKQMRRPQFEISSLSNLLKDPVSVDMIGRASHLSLELHDQNNRSPKEQERIKENLESEKKFISHYLDQTIQHLKIKLNLIEEKMAFLQNKAMQLIQNEKQLVHIKLADLHHQMKDFPKKWLLENQLKMKRDLTLKIIEGMTKLTESKVVNHHLFQIESKPLDSAFAPFLPKAPYLFLYAVLGGIFSAFFYYFYHFVKKFFQGFPVVDQWLTEKNLHFSGVLQRMKKNDLETWRNVAGFITLHQKKILLVTGSDLETLAELLNYQGLKILVMETTFQQSEGSGLLQYLTGKQSELSLIKNPYFDSIKSGGYTPFGSELLNHPKFGQLLSKLKKEYDCIFLLNTAKPGSAVISNLLQHSDGVIAIIHEETPQEIASFIEWEKGRGHKSLTFVKI